MLKKRMAASLPRWSKPMLLCLLVLLFTNISFAQQRITGTVTSANGEPVNGATVQVRGSNTATSTDAAGRFTIDAPSAATLVISSVGFTTQEVAVDGRSTIALSLEAADQSMNEVVVTALGIRREQRRLGYATTTVKPEELTINRTTNPMNALQGKVAGVQISAPSTGPGGSSKIRIRGPVFHFRWKLTAYCYQWHSGGQYQFWCEHRAKRQFFR
jgi:hypothetical protein